MNRTLLSFAFPERASAPVKIGDTASAGPHYAAHSADYPRRNRSRRACTTENIFGLLRLGIEGPMDSLGRTICRNTLFAVFSVALLASPAALSAQSAAEKALLARAQSLAAGGHPDLAVQTWQQVLLADSDNREALSGIARADMRSGRAQEADKYLQRLRAAGGSVAEIAEIQAMPSVQSSSERLRQASLAAQAGRYADAVRIYREVLGNTPPAGDSALAYYDTEAAIPEDRPNAIEGLRGLAKQFPADSRYTITLGRVLTYDPKTRSEGIAILKQYVGVPAAQSALQQAEGWSAAASAAGAGRPAAPRGPVESPLEASAYRALNAGRIGEAQQQFQSILDRQPANSRALTGMGYIFMKQQDFAAASDYLERARVAGARGLDSNINTAHFWQKMGQAGDDLKSEKAAAAVDGYRAALALKPTSVEALEGLAGALASTGDNVAASQAFQRAVRVAPQRADAWLGLFLAQSTAETAQAALDTSKRMPKSVRNQLANNPDYLRALAQNDMVLGNKAEADSVIQRALSLPFPNAGRDLPVQKQMQYAALLMTAGKYDPAIRLYRQVVTQDPENSGAWLALIAAQHQVDQDDDALASIARMPQSVFNQEQNDPPFLALVGSIYQTRHEWVRAQKYLERALSLAPSEQPGVALQLADIYAAQGDAQKAYTIYRHELDQDPENRQAWRGLLNALHQANRDREALRQLASMPDSVRLRIAQDPDYLQTLASIQAATGQTQAALATFAQLTRIYSDQNTSQPVGLQIQYGWVLLKAGDDHKLYSLVSALASSTEMTDEQQSDMRRLWAAWSLQRANILMKAGDQRRALAILEVAGQAFPGNPDVENTLAGAYLTAGQPRQALAIYATFDMDHATLPRYRGAIGAALAARDMKRAEAWLEIALDRYKGDPAILKMAAQFEQARGNNERAALYYQAALNAMGPAPVGDMFSSPDGPNGPDFPQDQSSPAQRLMQLLAPTGRSARLSEPLDAGPADRSVDVSWQDAPGQDTPEQNASEQNAPTLGDFAQSDQVFAPQGSAPAAQPYIPQRNNDDARADEARPAEARSDEARTAPMDPGPSLAFASPATEPGPRLRSTPDNDYQSHRRTSNPIRSPDRAALPSERDAPVPSAAYMPVSATLQPAPQEQEPAQEQTQYQAPYPQTTPDPNPAGRLQIAVQKMKSQSAGGQSWQPDNSGAPALPQTNSNNDPLAAPAPAVASALLPASALPPPSGLPPLTGPAIPVQRVKTEREEIEEQLAITQGASSAWLGGSSGVDYRSGQPGYDRLANYSAQIEGSSTLAPGVRTTIITRPVLLDSGVATGTSTLRQGTLAVGAVPAVQTASGVGGELQVRTSSVGVGVGYTPYGFLVQNIVGSLYIHPPASHFTLNFSRNSILDTQLSYAGLRDLGSVSKTYAGNVWGGVIANAGEGQLAFGDNRSGWYIQGGGQYITGRNVESNRRIDGDAGAYWAVWHGPENGDLSIGMNLFGMHYDNNLRYFTYGQGGYFSPGAYMLAGIPFTFNGHHGARFHYQATGSLGIQAFEEDSAPYFPLQSTVFIPIRSVPVTNPYYPASTSVGGNYSITGEGAYAIAEHWYVGGYLDFNNTRDYASEKIGFFMRYLIRPQPASEQIGPTGLFPVQGLRPLQVP
jgi:tetratricopeptide (TPR) repeat protein